MITLRKLASLPEGTRHRKILNLVREFEALAAAGEESDGSFLRGMMMMAGGDDFWTEAVRQDAISLTDKDDADFPGLRRALNVLGHGMAENLGRSWADWDAAAPADSDPSSYTPRFPFRIYLDGLRSPFNVGSVFRTAAAFGIERIWLSPDCTPADHPRSIRSAMGAVDAVPRGVEQLPGLDSSDTGTVFALELGGTDTGEFSFPESGTLVLGSEELGVRPEYLNLAENDGGVVSIALPGAKASLNVGVAFGILVEAWVRSQA